MRLAERLAFVHLMKTAGSYVDLYLRTRVLPPLGFSTHNSWLEGLGRDWSTAELEGIRQRVIGRAYVHNHAGSWPAATLETYRSEGWLTFSFVRHPGDQWCSHYFFSRSRGSRVALASSLDDYLRRAWSDDVPFGPRRELDLPDAWGDLDHVAVFDDEAFGRFLHERLGHDYVPQAPVNVGGNRGYEHYRATGEVSPDTHRLLLGSRRYARYLEVLARTSPNVPIRR